MLCLFFSCSLDEEILDESTGAELLEQEDIELNFIAPAYGGLTEILGCCGMFQLNELTTDEAVIPAKGLDWFDNGVHTQDLRFQDERIRAATGANLGFLVGPQFHPDGSPIEDSQLTMQTGNFVQLDYTPQISSLTQALQHEGVRVMKYAPDPESNAIFLGRNDYLLLRYADIWLMKAEALFRTGQAGALEQVNALREKRGMPPLANLTAELLLNERGFEFYWEGHRRQDLVRFGQFTAVTWAFKNVSEEYRNVFPIPQSVLSINENLVQNPGY